MLRKVEVVLVNGIVNVIVVIIQSHLVDIYERIKLLNAVVQEQSVKLRLDGNQRLKSGQENIWMKNRFHMNIKNRFLI